MTTISLALAAVYLSLTQTNDYLFTFFDNSNVVESIKGYGTSPYAIPRPEDFAFIHEASLERDLARRLYSGTNAYVNGIHFEPVTNKARFAHWYFSFGDNGKFELIQRDWFMTNYNYGCEQIYSSTNLSHIVNGLTEVADPDRDKLQWIRTDGFDQKAGFDGEWWTNGCRSIHYSKNFSALYNNLKAAEIIQDLKTPYQAKDVTGKRRDVVDYERYRFDYDEQGDVYWEKYTDKYDKDIADTSLDIKKSDTFHIHHENASLSLTRYAYNDIPGEPLGYDFSYHRRKDELDADVAYFNVAIVTNRSSESTKLSQGYQVIKSFALAEAQVNESCSRVDGHGTNVYHTTYWAIPVDVVEQKEDGTVTVMVGMTKAASEILRAMGYEELEKSGPILQEMAGGHPGSHPGPVKTPRSNLASIDYTVRILNLTSVIRMKWRSRWFETEEERDRER